MDCFDSNIDNDDTFDDFDNEEVYIMYDEEDIFDEEKFFEEYDDDFDIGDEEEEYDTYDEDYFALIDDDEFARDLAESMAMADEHPRFIARQILGHNGPTLQHTIHVGHIRNRMYVNSTFEAISTFVSGEVISQSVEQCVFINCTWFAVDISTIITKNTKFINCKFYNTDLGFRFMNNVTFENCTFINSGTIGDLDDTKITVKDCKSIYIYEIV